MKYNKELILKYIKDYESDGYNFSNKKSTMLSPFEKQTLYCTLRAIKPKVVLELGTYDGNGSSKIIIDACSKNDNNCKIWSFDLLSDSKFLDTKNDNIERVLTVGDIKETLDVDLVKTADFIFIDADHSYEFGEWYSNNILPALNKETLIFIHDWEGFEFNEDEMLAVKEHAIAKNTVAPIFNLLDHVMENPELAGSPKIYNMENLNNRKYHSMPNRSPTQVLEKL